MARFNFMNILWNITCSRLFYSSMCDPRPSWQNNCSKYNYLLLTSRTTICLPNTHCSPAHPALLSVPEHCAPPLLWHNSAESAWLQVPNYQQSLHWPVALGPCQSRMSAVGVSACNSRNIPMHRYPPDMGVQERGGWESQLCSTYLLLIFVKESATEWVLMLDASTLSSGCNDLGWTSQGQILTQASCSKSNTERPFSWLALMGQPLRSTNWNRHPSWPKTLPSYIGRHKYKNKVKWWSAWSRVITFYFWTRSSGYAVEPATVITCWATASLRELMEVHSSTNTKPTALPWVVRTPTRGFSVWTRKWRLFLFLSFNAVVPLLRKCSDEQPHPQ